MLQTETFKYTVRNMYCICCKMSHPGSSCVTSLFIKDRKALRNSIHVVGFQKRRSAFRRKMQTVLYLKICYFVYQLKKKTVHKTLQRTQQSWSYVPVLYISDFCTTPVRIAVLTCLHKWNSPRSSSLIQPYFWKQIQFKKM